MCKDTSKRLDKLIFRSIYSTLLCFFPFRSYLDFKIKIKITKDGCRFQVSYFYQNIASQTKLQAFQGFSTIFHARYILLK